MATHIVSTSVSFVRKHPFTLCCLALLFIPPVYRLLLFFTPLLASTALCVLALVSWVPNQGVPNMSDRKLNRLFDDTKEDKRENKRAEDVSMCYGEYERSAETSDETHWMDSSLLEGSSEDYHYHESLEERWRPQEADDGEQLNAHESMENSAEARYSEERQLQADMILHSPNPRRPVDYAGDDIGGGSMSVEPDREVAQIGSSSSEKRNGGGGIQQAQARRMSEAREGESMNEKVIAKLKMAMEREMAALEASLMAPELQCREEEHHHSISPTKQPYSLQESASC